MRPTMRPSSMPTNGPRHHHHIATSSTPIVALVRLAFNDHSATRARCSNRVRLRATRWLCWLRVGGHACNVRLPLSDPAATCYGAGEMHRSPRLEGTTAVVPRQAQIAPDVLASWQAWLDMRLARAREALLLVLQTQHSPRRRSIPLAPTSCAHSARRCARIWICHPSR